MTPGTGQGHDLERQRAEIEAEFRQGLVPADAGQPRVLSPAAHAEARKILDRGGATYLDPATIRAVREGARPGDPLPPTERQPLITSVGDDVDVIIVTDAQPHVAVLFSHRDFPGTRFGHRIAPPQGELARYETIWLAEEIATGTLHAMMRADPRPDAAGIIWTSWRAHP